MSSSFDREAMSQLLKARVVITDSGCWEWAGARGRTGYGQVQYMGRLGRAHRVAFDLFVRPIFVGEHICHHCDNPPCINPEHLFAGSNDDNVRDKVQKARGRKPIRHGTAAGAQAHVRRGEQPCDDCRTAYLAHKRRRPPKWFKDYKRHEGAS